MGASGLIAQLLLLRELLIVASGNELSIGIILGNWFILEALGAFFLGKRAEITKNKIEVFSIITFIFSISLLVGVYFTRILKNILGLSIGEGIGLLTILYSSSIILLPTSLSHGALFTFSCKIYSSFLNHTATIGKVYVYETIGTIVAGLVFSYFLIPYLDAFHIAGGLAVLNFFICSLLLIPVWKSGKLQKIITTMCFLFLALGILLIFNKGLDKLHFASIKSQWKNQKVVHYQNSIYGNICVIESDNQYTFFLDGQAHIITPIPDIVFVEEFVHLGLLSHPEPEKVLILSGGAAGVINEILKHPSVKLIEYAELDPLILNLLKKFPTPLTEMDLTDPRVKTKYIDGRLFLKTSVNKYDVIFVGLQEPSDLQTNRFFTKEFFSLAEKRLDEAGIIVIGLPGSLTYLRDELRDLNACIFNTLNKVFSYIRVIPGDGTNIFLASNSKRILSIDKLEVAEEIKERGLKANVTLPRHIEYKLHPGWVDWFEEFIKRGSQKVNYDFKPLGVFYSISYWNTLFTPYLSPLFSWFEKINLGIFFVLFVLFVSLFLLIERRKTKGSLWGIPFCISTTGFAGMIIYLALIYAFQAIYGYVFFWIGVLVTSFMAGAASGAMRMASILSKIKRERKFFMNIELAIIGFSLILPLLLFILKPYLDSPAGVLYLRILFVLLLFISGVLVGGQFPLANKIYFKNNTDLAKGAGLLYSSDLLGGWLGGVLGGVILLPILGVFGACIVVILFKLSSLIVITCQFRKVKV